MTVTYPNHARRKMAAGGLALGFGVQHLRTSGTAMVAAASGHPRRRTSPRLAR